MDHQNGAAGLQGNHPMRLAQTERSASTRGVEAAAKPKSLQQPAPTPPEKASSTPPDQHAASTSKLTGQTPNALAHAKAYFPSSPRSSSPYRAHPEQRSAVQSDDKLRLRSADRTATRSKSTVTAGPILGGRRRSKHRRKVYCGNNRLDPQLQENGGPLARGKPSECFRQGFGSALYLPIKPEDIPAFVKKYDAPYEKLIHQDFLWYKDSEPPSGKTKATLSQCRLRGWGAGSRELARREKHQSRDSGSFVKG